jgi:hypothetical protein
LDEGLFVRVAEKAVREDYGKGFVDEEKTLIG